MTNKEFISEVFEIAFGADAFLHEGDELVKRGFSKEECLETLREFEENAYKYEELG